MTIAPETQVSLPDPPADAVPVAHRPAPQPATTQINRWPSPMMIAALASIGAGGIHAAAAGAHGDHRLLGTMFVWVAAFQVCWGIAMLLRPTRALTVLGLVASAAIAGFWLVTRLRGISSIEGLEVREEIQFADALAAGLAVFVVGVALGTLLTPGGGTERRLANLSVPAFIVAALTLPAMVTVGTHQHAAGTDGHDHTATAAAVDEALPHSHEELEPVVVVSEVDENDTDENDTDENDTAVTAAPTPTATDAPTVVPPQPYDPTKPLDFSGIDGVSAEQQARAENLVAITLARLPQFADPAVAESLGWKSIGDGFLGYEHFINSATLADGRELDPDFPESLVYKVGNDGSKQLVSAMFMAEPGITLDTIPDVGGKLTQWHIHDNLCFNASGTVAGLRLAGGDCSPPLVTGPQTPMIHVWIVSHPCGPFAALEGIAAGQVKEGETRWCDHVHGA